MKLKKVLPILVLIVGVLWIVGVRVNVKSIDSIEVAKQNNLYGTVNCKAAADAQRMRCSASACKNALIAKGYAEPETSINLYKQEFGFTEEPNRFVHFARFSNKGKEWKLKCEMDYMKTLSITWAES